MTLSRPARIWLWIALIAGAAVPANPQTGGARRYIVELRGEPMARYLQLGPSAALSAARTESAEATTYRSQLMARQAVMKGRIEALPEARVHTQLDTVFNGMVVSLRPEDAAALEQEPDVAAVVPSVLYRKLLDAALPLVNAPGAWAAAKVGGEANAGAGIRIGIIDTGVDINHPMLQDAALRAPSGYPKFSKIGRAHV